MKRMMISLFFILSFLGVSRVNAHCQVPCGIYDDHMRIHMIEENITVIEKAMKEIVELSKAKDQNMNQMVRWVNEKEKHAQGIQDLAAEYFLTQRVQATWPEKSYHEALKLIHQLLQSAMKAKQTTDLTNVEALRKTLKSFETLYDQATAKK